MVFGYAPIVAAVDVPYYYPGVVAVDGEMPLGSFAKEDVVGSGFTVDDALGDDAARWHAGDTTWGEYDDPVVR